MTRTQTRALLRACLAASAHASHRDSELYCRRGGVESQLTTILDAEAPDGTRYRVSVTATMRPLEPREVTG